MRKSLFVIRFFSLLFFSLFFPFFFPKQFKIPPSHREIPPRMEWEIPASAKIQTILQQPFSFLAQGNQTTAFVSADGQYVLKLFRYRPTLFSLLHQCKNFGKKKKRKAFLEKMEKTFRASHLGCTEGAIFTQGLYAHLNLTEGQWPVIQLEKKGKTYLLALDRHRFILQRKVTSFQKSLLSSRFHSEEMKAKIDSLLSLLQQRIFHQIHNSDPNLSPNFGFLGCQAVELDFGNYQKLPPDLKREQQELRQYCLRLHRWLSRYAPEYVDYLQTNPIFLIVNECKNLKPS